MSSRRQRGARMTSGGLAPRTNDPNDEPRDYLGRTARDLALLYRANASESTNTPSVSDNNTSDNVAAAADQSPAPTPGPVISTDSTLPRPGRRMTAKMGTGGKAPRKRLVPSPTRDLGRDTEKRKMRLKAKKMKSSCKDEQGGTNKSDSEDPEDESQHSAADLIPVPGSAASTPIVVD